ncbi:MAG: hypothetical protein HZB56_03530 [Deltaproteobacteria bacterium]|nr:hypothetical protein [Deltaproteobacteria bacterium]
MDPSLPLRPNGRATAPADPLGLALALYAEEGMTEGEALCALHARVLARAAALDIRLDGERE